MNDNIRYEEFDSRTEGILNWIKENREKFEWAKDPNAYEMTNVFLLAARYKSQGRQINEQTLDEMWEIRKGDFEHAGVADTSFVYRICEDSYKSIKENKPLVEEDKSHQSLRKMAGIGLYLMQQKRDGNEINYDNPEELLDLIEDSQELKQKHSRLFERYKFDANLKKIAELQRETPAKQTINQKLEELLRGRSNNSAEEGI